MNARLEVLISEEEARNYILFGSLSSGISTKTKKLAWEKVAKSVNEVGAESRTVADIKKKWLDIKVDVKRKVSAHRRSVGQTGSGAGVGELVPFEQRAAAVMGIGSFLGRSRQPKGFRLGPGSHGRYNYFYIF